MTSALESLASDPEVQADLMRLRESQPKPTPRQPKPKREDLRQAAIKRWMNPKYRAYQAKLRKGRKFPKQGESLKRRWADPEHKERIVAAMKRSRKMRSNLIKARAAKLTKLKQRK